jgi:hypothetical protein
VHNARATACVADAALRLRAGCLHCALRPPVVAWRSVQSCSGKVAAAEQSMNAELGQLQARLRATRRRSCCPAQC